VTGRVSVRVAFCYWPGTRMIAPALEIAGEGIFGYQDKYGGHADLRVPAAS
jgi:hypothetical protein